MAVRAFDAPPRHRGGASEDAPHRYANDLVLIGGGVMVSTDRIALMAISGSARSGVSETGLSFARSGRWRMRSSASTRATLGIYSGYFEDPDGHLLEVIWNPEPAGDEAT